MKIIDRTPYYNDKGMISFSDRARATLKFGKSWLSEMEAQRSILPVMEKYLDRKYTLLRNATLPGLEASIPLLLVGPAGLYVFNVTSLAGIYRAKGDQWGTISGSSLRPEKINLLIRTEQLALAVQRYLQQESRLDIPGVESALVFTNPSTHVDSVRPIVRVVLCDALERFIISISEAAPVISQDLVLKVINQVTNPTGKKFSDTPSLLEKAPSVEGATPREILPFPASTEQNLVLTTDDDSPVSPGEIPEIASFRARDFSLPAVLGVTSESEAVETPYLETGSAPQAVQKSETPESSTGLLTPSMDGIPDTPTPWQIPTTPGEDLEPASGMIPLQSELSPEPYTSPLPESLFPGFIRTSDTAPTEPVTVKKKPVSGRQWFILGGLALLWIILTGILLFFILKDLI